MASEARKSSWPLWKRPDAAPALAREQAVIDVGSNSVRLVVYRVEGRAITPILNEKVMAGLGRELAGAGRLSPNGRQAALAAIQRFSTLLQALGVQDVDAVATAAVRDAFDGPEFTRQVAQEAGVKLRILSGQEEARLSALGVLAGWPEAEGVVGDLGGSSLELVPVLDGAPGQGETFPLGPLALMEAGGFDAAKVRQQALSILSSARALRMGEKRFFAVGGAWRALARLDLELGKHPIRVLQNHVMPRASALRVIEFVRRQSKKSLEKLDDAAGRRAETLPYAAVILESLIEAGGFETIVISSYGLREGLIYQAMPPEIRACHPLLAGAEALSNENPRARAFGAALQTWLEPAFSALTLSIAPDRDPLLRAAACRLADLGAALHPDQRAEIVFQLVLRAPFAGISHLERAFLATAVHHRYTKAAPVNEPAYVKLLEEDQRRAAFALGAAMRLGADLSGRSPALLRQIQLRIENGRLILTTSAPMRHLLTSAAVKRLEPLAEALGLEPQIQS